MRFLLLLTCFVAMCLIALNANAQRADSIAAVVNNEIVTFTDVYDRMNLIIKSSSLDNSAKLRERLLPQVLTGLITEKIQMQEAERIGLIVNEDEINEGFTRLAAQNSMRPEQFRAILKQQKIHKDTINAQIKSQLAWGKVIQSEIRPRINLTNSDIEKEIERLKTQEGQDQYFIAEIFLPVRNDTTEAQAKEAADSLYKQLSTNVSRFPNAARQFSQSATAANGGVIGWVTPDQMNPALAQAIKNTPLKKISRPVRDDGGYTILLVQNKRKVQIQNIESEETVSLKIAVLKLSDNQSSRKEIEDDAKILARDVKGCLDINEQVLSRDYATLREIEEPLSALPTGLKEAVEGVDIGDAGKIIERDNQIFIPVVCGREGGTKNTALEREIEMRLGTLRLDVLQKRYLRDLISNAYIERRI